MVFSRKFFVIINEKNSQLSSSPQKLLDKTRLFLSVGNLELIRLKQLDFCKKRKGSSREKCQIQRAGGFWVDKGGYNLRIKPLTFTNLLGLTIFTIQIRQVDYLDSEIRREAARLDSSNGACASQWAA